MRMFGPSHDEPRIYRQSGQDDEFNKRDLCLDSLIVTESSGRDAYPTQLSSTLPAEWVLHSGPVATRQQAIKTATSVWHLLDQYSTSKDSNLSLELFSDDCY